MTSSSNLFNDLPEQAQKIAVDIAVAATVLVTRLPTLDDRVFDQIAEHYGLYYGVPVNVARYAMKNLGRELFRSAWDMEISKNLNDEVITIFTPGAKPEDN